MANNSFRIIGIKAVYPNINELPENSPRHYEKVEAIQKVLFNTNKWYYFHKGIYISENKQNCFIQMLWKWNIGLHRIVCRMMVFLLLEDILGFVLIGM